MIITIDKIQESDFEELVFLFAEFAAFEKLPERMTNSLEQMKQEKDIIQGFIARDEYGDVAGYTVCFFTYFTWVGKSLYMDDLYVREKYRGLGVGSMLINKVIELGKSEKCNKVRWQVANWNAPAIKFYEKLGASIDDIERNCDLLL